jgi:hypothetical protein
MRLSATSNAFGEILECGDIDTIQIAAHWTFLFR